MPKQKKNKGAKASKSNNPFDALVKAEAAALAKIERPMVMGRRTSRVDGGSAKSTSRFPTGAAVARNRKTRDLVFDEYIADVNGSVAFGVTAFPVNPGLAVTFPWLSREAQLYEKYEVVQLQFYYKPEVSAFATNGQTGKIMLSFDYDAADLAPATKIQVEDSDPHSDGMPYETVTLNLDPAECNGSFRGKYIRPGAVPANNDIKTYDAGVAYVSTYGNANGTNIGELRVRGKIRLVKPILLGPGQTIQYAAATAGGTISLTNWFGTAPVVAGNLGLSLTGVGTGTTVGSFSVSVPGEYLYAIYLQGTGLNTTWASGSTGALATQDEYNYAGSTVLWLSGRCKFTAAGQNVTIFASPLPSTITVGQITLAQYPYYGTEPVM
jgi:hypothetical protein